MNIIILQGPNLNLLGLKSVEDGDRLTLDKLNKKIRLYTHSNDIRSKILQTHKVYKAINFLQRNRNWADGILFIPMSWAKYQWTIKETLDLISIPAAFVFFDPPFDFGTPVSDSILNEKKSRSFSGSPIEACENALDYLKSMINL